jgi:hypothetical protein
VNSQQSTNSDVQTATDDDFWGEGAATPTPSVAATSLRTMLAERFGIQVGETDTDEAVVTAIVNRLQQQPAPDSPLQTITTRLALDDRGLVRQRMVEELAANESEFANEIDEELDRLADLDALGKKAAGVRRQLEAQKTRLEGEAQQQTTNQQEEYNRKREEFEGALKGFEFEGVKFPEKQVPILKNYIESGEYIRQMTQGVWGDGTAMKAEELVEQAVFANPTFRQKFIARAKQEAAKKAVSDYIAKMENRVTPTETGGFQAPVGMRTVGHREFFGG